MKGESLLGLSPFLLSELILLGRSRRRKLPLSQAGEGWGEGWGEGGPAFEMPIQKYKAARK